MIYVSCLLGFSPWLSKVSACSQLLETWLYEVSGDKSREEMTETRIMKSPKLGENFFLLSLCCGGGEDLAETMESVSTLAPFFHGR